MATLKDGELYSGVEGHQPLAYAVTQIPLLSLQLCRDFQTRKLALMLFDLHKLYRTRKFLENNITSFQDKPTDVNIFALSLTV